MALAILLISEYKNDDEKKDLTYIKGNPMRSKYSLLVTFLLSIICFLIAAIYFQSMHLNKSSSGVITHDRDNISEIQKDDYHPVINVKDKKDGSKIYYIDYTKGNNRASGTSKDKAWKDFANIKKRSFAEGDTILLKRGEIWDQTLFPPAGGNESGQVFIDAYGTGELPVIDVQNRLSAAIRIYHSYISINNLRIQNSTNDCIAISVDGGLSSIKLKNIEILNAGNNGIAVSNGGKNLEISGCYIENAHNNGIYLGGSAENKLGDVKIYDCHIIKASGNDGITIHEDGKGNTAGSNFLFKNNIAEMCAEQGFDITTGENILLLNNISNMNRQGGIVVGHSAKNITIKGHKSTDEPTEKTSAAINLMGLGNIRLLNSIVKGNGYHLLSISTNNVAVANNNFIWNGGEEPIDISGKIENIYFINNIVYSKQYQMRRIRFLEASRPPDYQSFYFDYNLYHVPDNDVIFYSNNRNYNFKEYQKAFKVEMNSRNVNPEFSNPLQDEYQLKQNSPAIDRGCFYTNPVSQGIKNKFAVKNALFFYKNFVSDDYQRIMFKGINETYDVVDVNYENNTISLNKDTRFALNDEIGTCYTQAALDIGAHEFEKLP